MINIYEFSDDRVIITLINIYNKNDCIKGCVAIGGSILIPKKNYKYIEFQNHHKLLNRYNY